MQAGPDAPPSHAGLARTAEGDRASPAHRPEGGVSPSVLQAAAAAASRLATEGPPKPFELTAHDDYELAAPDAAQPPSVAAATGPGSDEALMQAFAAGDPEAFTRLYDRHERSTWRFIRHRLGRAHETAADDVMQEAWISVARAAPRYVATARFTTWLFAIARSRVIDFLRTQAHATLSLDAALDAMDNGPANWSDELRADAASEPQVRVESRQQAEAFLNALGQLPALQREAFVLQAEAGMSVEEIAQATGVVAETAKTRLRYAKARLRDILAGWRPT